MAAPDIILYQGEILLIQSSSALGIEFDNAPFLFGTVEGVNAVSDNFAVDDIVGFDPTDATKILYDNDIYYLTKETKIKFKENPPV